MTDIKKLIPADICWTISKLEDETTADWLSASEKKQLLECNNPHRRREFITGRKLARELAEQLGMPAQIFSLQKDELGKPFGQCGETEVHVSLAHSVRKVMCALSKNRRLGVDLEPLSREVHERLGARIYHPEESPEIRALPLIQLWTIKEALVKLKGDGLRTNLKDLRISQLDLHKFSAEINDDKTAIICSFRQEKHWISISYYQLI